MVRMTVCARVQMVGLRMFAVGGFDGFGTIKQRLDALHDNRE